MVRVRFAYRDEYTHGEWKEQECIVSSLEECVYIYGLNKCQWMLLSIEEIK